MPDPSATGRGAPAPLPATPRADDWCGQCLAYGDHETNRCPVGEDVRCLTHHAWMKRGSARCEALRVSGACEAAS